MNTVYILIFVFGSFFKHHSVITVTAEFNSLEACSYARQHLAKMQGASGGSILSQGCFKK